MRFSVIYKPTTLFSLKDSNSTNSGAKSLFLPSPYSIKMAIINQAILIGGEDFYKNNTNFQIIKNAKIEYFIKGNVCVNNCFVKIQKQKENKTGSSDFEAGILSTVSFREYIYLSDNLEVIFNVADELHKKYLTKYLHKINYFGKRGCFFQFVEYIESPSEPNVKSFDAKDFSSFGILQKYDDFDTKTKFENVDSYNGSNAKRNELILTLPYKKISSSKSYTNYKV